MMFPLVLLPPILRLCIALFAVAEGCLLLDIGWFVLFLFSNEGYLLVGDILYLYLKSGWLTIKLDLIYFEKVYTFVISNFLYLNL